MTRSIGEVGRQKSFFGENRDSHKTLFMNVADSFSIGIENGSATLMNKVL